MGCCQYRMIGVQASAGELIKGRMIEDPDTLGSWSLSSICWVETKAPGVGYWRSCENKVWGCRGRASWNIRLGLQRLRLGNGAYTVSAIKGLPVLSL